MNRRQLEYAVRLAEVRNFSALSSELRISQPALSKQIGALEQELGIKLFDRSTSPLTLTPAGAYFIEEAKRMVFAEDQLLRTMEQFKDGKAGRLTIGVSPFRCVSLMPRIVKAVREQFPQVEVVLQEAPSAQLRHDVMDGKFDFAILNLPVEESVLEAVPIETESLVLVVPNELAETLPASPAEPYPAVSFADCKDLPFVTVSEGQEMRQLFDKICAASDVHPTIAARVVSLSAALQMANAGVGAALLPLPFLKDSLADQHVTLFTIQGNTYHRQSAVVTRRGQPLSDCARYAISLLTE